MRYELERAHIDAVLKLADTLIERGAIDEAHPIVDRALGIDPYSDALARGRSGWTPAASGRRRPWSGSAASAVPCAR